MKISAHNISLTLDSPKIMAVLNVNQDSFYDGGRYSTTDKALSHAIEMVEQGAHIIDIGAESSRPGALGISQQEEIDRVVPIVKALVKKQIPAMISIDTVKAEVARQALDAGAHIVNDINGLQSADMRQVAAAYSCPVVLMHMQGKPQSMQISPQYKNVIQEIKDFFIHQISLSVSDGIVRENIILDPGIGFGKTLEHNISIIQNLASFTDLGLPVLIGASRKSMIGTILDQPDPEQRLTGTLLLHYQSILNGAQILRVHDVKEHVEMVKMHNAMQKST